MGVLLFYKAIYGDPMYDPALGVLVLSSIVLAIVGFPFVGLGGLLGRLLRDRLSAD